MNHQLRTDNAAGRLAPLVLAARFGLDLQPSSNSFYPVWQHFT